MLVMTRVGSALAATFVGAAVLCSNVLPGSGEALAQTSSPTATDRETARTMMDDGDKKRDAGDMRGALKSYERADGLMKVPTTGIEVARAQIALGLLLEAREVLARVLRTPAKAGEPGPFAAARKNAAQLDADLAARIPSILVVAKNPEPGQPPQVTIDGETIPATAADVPRSGALEKKQDVTVAERETKTITLDLKDQPKAAEPPPPPPPPQTGLSTPKLMMLGGFGLAAVGLGVGTITGLASLSKTSELKDACPDDKCPLGKQPDIDAATSLGTVSTIAFIVGGVGAGIGVVGLVLSAKEPKEAAAAAALARRQRAFAPSHVRALLGPSYVGIAGAF